MNQLFDAIITLMLISGLALALLAMTAIYEAFFERNGK